MENLRADYVVITKITEQWIESYQPMPNGSMRTIVGNKGHDANGILWRFKYDTMTDYEGRTSFGSSYGFIRA